MRYTLNLVPVCNQECANRDNGVNCRANRINCNLDCQKGSGAEAEKQVHGRAVLFDPREHVIDEGYAVFQRAAEARNDIAEFILVILDPCGKVSEQFQHGGQDRFGNDA